ncbi:MAG TPA: deoxyribose-phosphate aldolase [Acidimicrobiales bacterium]|nr:deoxyribose-phosphate aldolase [Acidimicrobiales bacterium]
MSIAPLRLVTSDERGVRLPSDSSVPVIENETQLRALLSGLSGVDAVGAEARAAKLATRSLKKSTKLAALDLAISMVDLTTLEGADTPGRVTSLCTKALHPDPSDPNVPSVAAVCVYPDLVAHARSVLGASPVKVASVATAFPSGRASLNIKLMDVREAVSAGADEIDMVIDRGAFLSGRVGQVFDEVVAVKEACGAAHLKVILETGELATYDNARRASWIAMLGGADFIKTSTGKVGVNATLPTALVMLEAVRDFAETTGVVVGVKVAGGIRTTKDALRYLVVINETAGSRWLSPDYFRFGASSLLNDLLMQRLKQRRGVYVRPDEFSGD